jgi:murein DD-endopeptidase MepM/ murein hydrolase activator NlpD
MKMRIKNTLTAALAATVVAAIAPAGAGASAAPQTPTPDLAEPEPSGPYLPLTAPLDIGDGLGASRGHEGVDLFGPIGTELVAVSAGEVIETGSDGGRGNYVSIYSRRLGNTYNYFHMNTPALVATGEKVRAGQVVGYLGCTGSCYGAHLHFEVRDGRSPYAPVLDPLPVLDVLAPPPAEIATPAAESPSEAASPALP